MLHERVPELLDAPRYPPFDSHLFTGLEHRQFRHPGQRFDLPGLLDLVRSRSYIATLPARERATVLDRVSRLVREHAALRGRTTFRLPYVANAWRATKT